MKCRYVKLPLIFTHSIPPRDELVDVSCLKEHIHDDAVLTVMVKSEWVDFKAIKRIVLECLDSYDNDGTIISLGLTDTEGFIDSVGQTVLTEMKNLLDDERVEVKVHLQETSKYAISDVYKCPL